MTGLKDDETHVENLYEDCKSFLKINPPFRKFPGCAGEVQG